MQNQLGKYTEVNQRKQFCHVFIKTSLVLSWVLLTGTPLWSHDEEPKRSLTCPEHSPSQKLTLQGNRFHEGMVFS